MSSDQLFETPDEDDRKPWQRSENEYPYGGKAPFVSGSDTSEEAARSIEPNHRTVQGRVLKEIRTSGGITDDEIEVALSLSHQTASARRRELVMLDLVIDTGFRRPTRSGRKATVWAAR